MKQSELWNALLAPAKTDQSLWRWLRYAVFVAREWEESSDYPDREMLRRTRLVSEILGTHTDTGRGDT